MNETYSKKPKPKPNKVCIFDIDNTLTHGADANSQVCPGVKFINSYPPDWPKGGGTTDQVKNVIQACKQRGFAIATASAESGREELNENQRAFLKHLDPVFTDDFINSPRLQYACTVSNKPYCTTNEFGNKAGMYQNIMNYYGIPPDQWKNSVVFDDDLKNINTASELGFKTCMASQECSGRYCSQGCGVRSNCIGVLDNTL